MRIIAGKEFNSTPVFMDSISYIVFSPYWNIPKSITKDEVVPAMQRNSSFLSNNNMEVINGWGRQYAGRKLLGCALEPD